MHHRSPMEAEQLQWETFWSLFLWVGVDKKAFLMRSSHYNAIHMDQMDHLDVTICDDAPVSFSFSLSHLLWRHRLDTEPDSKHIRLDE